MSRTYILLRSRTAGVGAALAVCLLIAGCGGGGSSTVDTSTTAASSADGSAFNPSLAGNSGASSAGNASALLNTTTAAPPPPSKPANDPVTTTTAAPRTVTVTTPAPPPRTVTVTDSKPSKPSGSAKPKTVVRVVKQTVTKTVTRTVATNVAPDVPSGAFMPAAHPALAQASFTVPGNNVGCAFAGGDVRCDIEKRSWTPPSQPRKCSASWGNAVVLKGTGMPSFVCGGASAFSANAKVVPDGWDDKFGGVTCQVRSFGVNCFSTKHHGFIVSRTGYTLY